MADQKHPKIVQKALTRAALLLFTLAALFLGWQWLASNGKDLNALRTVDTKGMISAIEFGRDGQQLVVFAPDGKIIKEPKYTEGDVDRDPTWQPNGNALFFVSDRKDNVFHIFRWNPGFEAELRTQLGTRSRNNPSFAVETALTNRDAEALITSGGKVLALDPRSGETRQMLPPVGKEVPTGGGEDGAGSASQFDAVYAQFGDSFKGARWCGNQQFIAAIMGRDSGEVLILQDMNPKDERDRLPFPIAAGEKIQFDVNPADGTLVFSVQGFLPPNGQIPKDWIKNGKVKKPFENLIARFDPFTKAPEPIATSPSNETAFGSPKISPDGATVLVVIGSFEPGASLMPKGLFAMPNKTGGGQLGAGIVQGEVFEPSWSPDGSRIVYAKREGGKRSIFTAAKDGSSERSVSGGQGNYGTPLYSPQVGG